MKDTVSIVLWITALNIIFFGVLNFGLAFLVRVFPKRFYNANLAFYREQPFEKTLYIVLRVAKWKDRLPEGGRLVGFSKRTLESPNNEAYISEFITETCIGEFVHYLGGTLGYFSLFLTFLVDGTTKHILVFIIIATLNFLGQVPFAIIQRYNRPRLIRLKNNLMRKYK